MGMDDTPLVVIVEASLIVAEDIAGGVRDLIPAAEIHICNAAASALGVLQAAGRIPFVVVGLDPESIRGSGLAQAVDDRGGRLLHLDLHGQPGATDPRWLYLNTPFTTDSLGAALRRLVGNEPGWDEVGG